MTAAGVAGRNHASGWRSSTKSWFGSIGNLTVILISTWTTLLLTRQIGEKQKKNSVNEENSEEEDGQEKEEPVRSNGESGANDDNIEDDNLFDSDEEERISNRHKKRLRDASSYEDAKNNQSNSSTYQNISPSQSNNNNNISNPKPKKTLSRIEELELEEEEEEYRDDEDDDDDDEDNDDNEDMNDHASKPSSKKMYKSDMSPAISKGRRRLEYARETIPLSTFTEAEEEEQRAKGLLEEATYEDMLKLQLRRIFLET